MKIAFLEYRPWVLWDAIAKLKEMGVEDIHIIYYRGDRYDPSRNDEIESECHRLNIELSTVKNLGFEKKLDEYYADTDIVFFFHMTLPGDRSERFNERINVKYAEQKHQAGDNRIWFYTTAGSYYVDLLNKTFGGNCIPVPDFDVDRNQLVFDYDYIGNHILQQNHV